MKKLFLSFVLFFLGVSIACFAQVNEKSDVLIDTQPQVGNLKNPNAEVRGLAACYLGEAKATSAISELIDLLKDNSPIDVVACGGRGKWKDYEPPKSSSPGKEAARSLGSIAKSSGNPFKVMKLLIDVLQSNNAHARLNAVFALGVIANDRAFDSLLPMLKDESAEVRGKTVWALATLNDKRAVTKLIEVLSDNDPKVRGQATWALGVIRDESAVPHLINAATDNESSVREKAIYSLGTYKDVRSVPTLIAALKDQSPTVREKAAWGLGVIKDARALKDLLIAAKDDNPKVRKNAEYAISLIKSEMEKN